MASPSKWGIWCLPLQCWVNESCKANGWTVTDCQYDTRREAVSEMEDMVMKHNAKDYEVRKYEETT